MFDSDLCTRPISKVSLFLLPLEWEWLAKPLLIIIPILTLVLASLGVRWVVKNTRLKRWLNTQRAFLLLFGFTATLPLMFIVVAKGLVVFFASDPGMPADAIVMLGRGWSFYNRVDVAAELWQAKRAPIIFSSGNGDTPVMIEKLEAQGIPDRVIDGENCSLTTEENAVFTAAILHSQARRRIILVTDEPHILRSLLVFRAKGFTVIPHPTPRPHNVGVKAEAFLTLREYMGIVNYAFRGLFFQQRSPELNNPQVAKLVQEAEQYGKQRHLQQES